VIVLQTPRLVLRELVPEDLDFVATMLGHPEVSRYYERTFARYDSEVWLERQRERYRRDGHGLWLAQERDGGTPVGQVGLALQDVEGERLAEIGWLLHRPYWGRGYATEAGAAVRDAAFTRWGHPSVISLIRPVNLPSQKVALRIGLTPGRRVLFHGFEHIVFGLSRPPQTGTEPKTTEPQRRDRDTE
jgi:ribosomal-protein-alanine N-acetyltransferase